MDTDIVMTRKAVEDPPSDRQLLETILLQLAPISEKLSKLDSLIEQIEDLHERLTDTLERIEDENRIDYYRED